MKKKTGAKEKLQFRHDFNRKLNATHGFALSWPMLKTCTFFLNVFIFTKKKKALK